jgi:predicted transcriptional regulator
VHPKYPRFFLTLAKNGVDSSLILTPGVYRVIKEKYRDLLEEWLECGNAHLYVPDNEIKFSFVVTDRNVSLSFFYNSGAFDSKRDVVSVDPSARRWGETIFSYYQKQSKKIIALD